MGRVLNKTTIVSDAQGEIALNITKDRNVYIEKLSVSNFHAEVPQLVVAERRKLGSCGDGYAVPRVRESVPIILVSQYHLSVVA
jgi:hypothetical protein